MKTSIPKDLCEAILKEMLPKKKYIYIYIYMGQSMTCVLCHLCEKSSGHVERYMLVRV